jgi:NADH:ubiquinone oxidoreductase subunit E
MAGTRSCSELQADQQAQFDLLHQVIQNYERKDSNLIQILHMAQAIFPYLSDDVLHFIGEEMDLPLSKIHGVVSFYSYFETRPHGRHTIQVCLGTACYVRGGSKVLDNLKKTLQIEVGETSLDGRFTLEVKRCFGACGLAPAIAIDNVIHKRVNANKLQEILNQYP